MEAVSSTDWAQLVSSKDINSDPIKINKDIFIIGRSKDCDFIIENNQYVSAKHCQITKEGDSKYLIDTSLNGTLLNGHSKISKRRVLLNHGDEINIVHQPKDYEKNVAYMFQELSRMGDMDTSGSTVELNNTIAYNSETVLEPELHEATNILSKRKRKESGDDYVGFKKNVCLDPKNCAPSTSNKTLNDSSEIIILNSGEDREQMECNINCKVDLIHNNDKDLLESLICTICQEIFYKCISLQPCMHSFCSGCYSVWMNSSNECPTCRGNVERINRNHLINNLVETYLKKHPDEKRDDDDIKKLDAQNKITADMLNIKKKKVPTATLR